MDRGSYCSTITLAFLVLLAHLSVAGSVISISVVDDTVPSPRADLVASEAGGTADSTNAGAQDGHTELNITTVVGIVVFLVLFFSIVIYLCRVKGVDFFGIMKHAVDHHRIIPASHSTHEEMWQTSVNTRPTSLVPDISHSSIKEINPPAPVFVGKRAVDHPRIIPASHSTHEEMWQTSVNTRPTSLVPNISHSSMKEINPPAPVFVGRRV